jgi:hypothetical protein
VLFAVTISEVLRRFDCLDVDHFTDLRPSSSEPSSGFDRVAGAQIGSNNVQFNYFYGYPARTKSTDTPITHASEIAGSPCQGHVFISYVREDSDEVNALQNTLEATGIPVWRDTASLWPGEDWRTKIRQAITHDTLVFIACFSSHSAARQRSHQNEELLLAIDQLRLRKPDFPWLIPVRFDECDVPDLDLGAGRSLGSIQRADLFGANRDQVMGRLMTTVRRLLP